jgi:O-antigen/teichoic acid export membrane protein
VLFTAIELLRAMRNSSINTISVAGHFKQTSKYAVIESIINITLSIALVWWLGMYGVLIGTVVAFAYRNIVSIHYSNKHILGRSSLHSIKIAVVNIALIVAIGFACNFINMNISGYGMWVVNAAIVSVLSFVIFFAVNSAVSPKSFGELVSYMKRKIIKKKREDNAEKHD